MGVTKTLQRSTFTSAASLSQTYLPVTTSLSVLAQHMAGLLEHISGPQSFLSPASRKGGLWHSPGELRKHLHTVLR